VIAPSRSCCTPPAGGRSIGRSRWASAKGGNRAVVLVDGDAADAEAATLEALEELNAFVERAPTLESRDEETLCEFFEITDAERGATDAPLSALVGERVALLEVEK